MKKAADDKELFQEHVTELEQDIKMLLLSPRAKALAITKIGGKRIFSFESWQVAVKFGFKLNK